jgi:PAS domain-containing protein
VVQNSGVWRHRKKSGEIIWVEIGSHALSWEGRLARLVLAQDVTEREQARGALEGSERRFRQAILESPFPLMLHAEDGEVLQVSESWCELTGYEPAELRTIADWTERAYGERKAQGLKRPSITSGARTRANSPSEPGAGPPGFGTSVPLRSAAYRMDGAWS